jgi:hypothetical protein
LDLIGKSGEMIRRLGRSISSLNSIDALPARTGINLESLDNHRNALTSPDTGGSESVSPTATLKFMEKRQNQPRTGRSERVTEGDCPAVYVCSRSIQT